VWTVDVLGSWFTVPGYEHIVFSLLSPVLLLLLHCAGFIESQAAGRASVTVPTSSPITPGSEAPPIPARRNIPPPVPARPTLASIAAAHSMSGSTSSLPAVSTTAGSESPGTRPPVPTRAAPVAAPRGNMSSSATTAANHSSAVRSSSSGSLANGGNVNTFYDLLDWTDITPVKRLILTGQLA